MPTVVGSQIPEPWRIKFIEQLTDGLDGGAEIFTKLLGILEPLLKPTILDVVAEVLDTSSHRIEQRVAGLLTLGTKEEVLEGPPTSLRNPPTDARELVCSKRPASWFDPCRYPSMRYLLTTSSSQPMNEVTRAASR